MLTARRLVARHADKEVHGQGDLPRLDTQGGSPKQECQWCHEKDKISFNKNAFL